MSDNSEALRLERSKLAVIGAGAVGSSLAYASLIRGSAHEIVLYDVNKAKVEAEAADLAHGTLYTPAAKVAGSDDISIVKDSSVVIITAGAKQKPGQTRMELAKVNATILEDLMPKLIEQAPDAVYVLVTNPCDVLTVVAQKISGLPVNRVFSTGTMLDTSRLRYAIADLIHISPSHVHATIMGEHGDSEFPVWSNATINHIPITKWREPDGSAVFTQKVLDDLAEEAMRAAYHVIEGKGATNYAIGVTGARLTEALLQRTRSVLPVSSVLQGFHGLEDVALSVPSIVSSAGVEEVLDVPINEQEEQLLLKSGSIVRESLKSIGY